MKNTEQTMLNKQYITFLTIVVGFLLFFHSCKPKDKDFFSSFGFGEMEQLYTLNLTTTGEGVGTITSDDGKIDCPPNCDGEFPENYKLELFVNYDIATTTIQWFGDFEEFGSMDKIEVNMTSNLSGGVNFDPIPTQTDELIPGLYPIDGLSGIEKGIYLNGVVSNYRYSKTADSKQTNEVSFGNLSGSFITAFAGAEGYQILDLATGDVLKEETNLGGTGPFFGIAGATQDPPGPDSPAMLLLAGANGFVLDRLDQFGPLEFDGTTFDVFPAGGDPVTNVVTHVLPGAGVGFYVFDDAQDLYVPAEVGFPVNLFGGVQLISAYMHDDLLSDDPVPQPRGNFLVLSRESESGVFLVKWDGSDPVRAIDNIGFDARRIRCIEDGTDSGNLICAASIFGHDRLGLMTWDGENVPVLTDFAEIGDGPVGIDLRHLPDGTIGIVSTGFNDNTLTETVISTNGRVQSNNTRSVLNGCQSPGHAIYIEDAESLKILGTCYNSNHYFVVESEL